MLVLFDIDGTILKSERAGALAMIEAGKRLVGPHFSFDGVEISGRLDPLIWRDAASAAGVADPDGGQAAFRALYAEILAERLRTNPTAKLLPGVREIVDMIETQEIAKLGVLTGNYRETGRIKITSAGLDPDRFIIEAWGDEAPTRPQLVPVAQRRHEEKIGLAINGERIVIIGDTVHDIDCARANGCRVIAVGTGGASMDDLAAREPDLLLDDLSAAHEIVRWIFNGVPISTS